MNKSMRSVLCMVCACLSPALFGMQTGEKLTLEDALNQAAAEHLQKNRMPCSSGVQVSLTAPVVVGVVTSIVTLFETVQILGGGVTSLIYDELTEGKYKKQMPGMVAQAIRSNKSLLGALFGEPLLAGGIAGAVTYGLEYMTIKRASADKETLERLLNFLVLNAKIDESKLTPGAKALLAELRKRAEAKKDQN